MLGDEDRRAVVGDGTKRVEHPSSRQRVEVGQWSVQDEVPRSHRQEAGQHDALLLTAREAARVADREVGDVQAVKRGSSARHDIGPRQAQVGRPEGDLLEDGLGHHRELRGRPPETDDDMLDEPMHGPLRRDVTVDGQVATQPSADHPWRQPAEHHRERGKARPGRAEQAGERPIGQLE